MRQMTQPTSQGTGNVTNVFLFLSTTSNLWPNTTQVRSRRQEEEHISDITSTLKQCNSPAWNIHKARKDM